MVIMREDVHMQLDHVLSGKELRGAHLSGWMWGWIFLMMLVMVWLCLRSFWMMSPSSFAWEVCEGGVADVEVDLVVACAGVEDGVVGFGWVRDEVVAVEVGDEVAEFGLG